ncbi:MAG: SDR family oxidoreductase [Proteobacteria bacterium]|nr:MAG: SDR family oxidoreductase [Pseudomonadota bacterium]
MTTSNEEAKYPKNPLPAQHQAKPGIESKLDPRPLYMGSEYKAAGKLEGKVAIITGADSGIGRSVAILYAKEGAKIVFTYLDEEESDADETVAAIEELGGEVECVAGDLKDYNFCEKVVQKALDSFGQIDILVNNAAFQNHVESLEKLSIEQWDKTFRTNIYGYFYMSKAVLPHLKDGAAIINTGSITGMDGSAELLDYSATKGAIHAFTKSLAQSLVERRIRVNCVAPGPVWTPLNPSDRDAEEIKSFGASTPYKRPAQPEEIAPAYVYFASNADSSYVTGEIISLLGGKTTAS